MRYFGLYFAFFAFLFSFLFGGGVHSAAVSASGLLFSYFVFTSAISVSVAFVLFLALKRGFSFAALSPMFSGLLGGAAGLFFLNLLANRAVLLVGSYVLAQSAKSGEIYSTLIAIAFLAAGYTIFRPFNFDFKGTFAPKGAHFETHSHTYTDNGDTTIDVEVIEDYEKLEHRS
jgi:hypothetical protein